MRRFKMSSLVTLVVLAAASARADLPTVDLSQDTTRQAIVAAGTKQTYQGHPTTVLLPDGRTMFAVWTENHGGPCGPMKRSDDGGKTWSELLPVPANWSTVKNCPTIYRLADPSGTPRLVVFAGQGPDGAMHSSHSTDDGKTWTPMKSLGLKCVMPFCTIVPIDGGQQLLGLTNIRRPGETKDKKSNIIAQSLSSDGGLTWSEWRIVLDLGDLKPCEPELVRSPDTKQLLCLLRENAKHEALFMTSDDEGRTWSDAIKLPRGLWGDRHKAAYTADGRLVVCFRDTGPGSKTKSHFVAWVGKYADVASGRDGQYRVKLLHSNAGGDCGYPGLEVLPGGTLVATTYVKYRPGPEKHSVVAVRFNLNETDALAQSVDSNVVEADIVIYGGTSGGVAAAVQASRMGKKAVLVEPGKHLGGMTSGGLSAVDIGDPRTVGGISREYFTRLVARYGKELEWDKAFTAVGGGPATGGAYSIEPHVAEDVFNVMARDAGVPVHLGARLKSVKKDGTRIVELTTDEGLVVRGKMFIDATYEGDLMAAAGVTYTLQREGNKKYGETYNGIYYDAKYEPRTNHLTPGPHGRVPGGQGVWDRDFPLDPYVVAGDPSSGLLPLIEAGEPGTPGEPAPGVQAYCFRLCLTKSAHRLPIAPPPNYDPQRYEIVARFIAACEKIGDDVDLRWFSKHDALPNNKWDFNTATFGGNLPGVSWRWPEASYAEREKIAKEHENYHRGLLHFLANDERVPSKVREEMRQFGLPRDEFKDNGGWPHQLYIREARRMVSDLVITEHHTFGRATAPNSVSLGSYGTDTHEIRRIVRNGVVAREGKTAGGRDGAPPYPIGYAAIVPKAKECDNLFVTFALSASHTAFSSIRMEPVFMVTNQSAATAASIAIDDDVPVQQVDYKKLRKRLDADKQIVEWKPTVKKVSATKPTPKILFDTDMLTDCDDAGALAVLHALADAGECEILATVCSVPELDTGATVLAINRYYGRESLPLGLVKSGGVQQKSKFVGPVAREFAHQIMTPVPVRDAIDVYREVLEKQPDGSVTIVTVGYLTNLKNLLQLPASGDRPSGRELVEKKVAKWVCLGGNFVGSPPKDDLKLGNVNFQRDAASAHYVITNWPGSVVFVGREIGSVPSGLELGESLVRTPSENPVRRAYEHYFDGTAKNRHVADLTAVLYAVHGERDYWDVESQGYLDLRPDMTFEWKLDADKDHAYLLKKPGDRVLNDAYIETILDDLLVRAPGDAPTAATNEAEATQWEQQAAADAKQDRTTIAFDGVSPNKEVCDATLRRMPDGTWALYYLGGGDVEPSPLNRVTVIRSTDEGRTWSEPEIVDTSLPREGLTMGQAPSELMIAGDESLLFFGTHSKHWRNDWQSWIMRSSDSGKTWTKAEPAPGRLRHRSFIRNHIVTRDGRIMLPWQHYIGPENEQSLPPLERKFTNPRNGVIVSRDGGKTWTEHGNIRLTENDQYFGWAEANIVELSDGRIAMVIRADKLGGVLYYAESNDGGLTWPDMAVKTDIPNPGSKATLYGLGGDTVAILHNPNPAHRSPMALWISFDGLKTWPYRRVLQAESCDGPKGRMNYPDGFVSADKQYLHFAFDDNRHRAVYYGAKLPPLPKP